MLIPKVAQSNASLTEIRLQIITNGERANANHVFKAVDLLDKHCLCGLHNKVSTRTIIKNTEEIADGNLPAQVPSGSQTCCQGKE